MEMSRIELETSHMRSERSTTELHPQVQTLWLNSNNFFSIKSKSHSFFYTILYLFFFLLLLICVQLFGVILGSEAIY